MKPPKKLKTLKKRLDILVVERGLAESRQRAQAMILAGEIRVNQQAAPKAGAQVALDAQIELSGPPLLYASRGGLKLQGALDDFAISPAGLICMDVGSSTGGFTDCLLQRGALRVYAIDVTTSQIAWKLRQDSRVVLIECNARYLKPPDLPERAELVVIDVSFISVCKVLPALVPLVAARANFLILVKPQFELQPGDIGKGGIVLDPHLHARALENAHKCATALGLQVLGHRPSHLKGAQGNQEYFLHARQAG
ncbi:MAG: TlyA family RNA methyltransferase [Acidipila sp.]|nr:TlyA family RNA methyltransferase [Acidipila sp.]